VLVLAEALCAEIDLAVRVRVRWVPEFVFEGSFGD
jgi:hypothetical protein